MPRLSLPIIVLTVALIHTASVPLPAQNDPTAAGVDPAIAALVERLLSLTRAAELIAAGIENAIPAQRLANPEIPEEFWDEFAARARSDTSRFVGMLIPIYAAHLSRNQLEQLVAFYESPIGQEFAAVQPLIAQESMAAGRRWGAQLGAEIGAELAERGVHVP